jgi:heat shock protein HtpX
MFIVKPLTGFSMQSLFSSHPPTAERVARLRSIRVSKNADLSEQQQKSRLA